MNDRSRRDFLKASAVGAVGVSLPFAVATDSAARAYGARPANRTGHVADETTLPIVAQEGAVRLGVASYSLREFPRDYVIRAMQELQTPYINIKSFHLPYEDTPEQLAAGRREFEDAGLQIVGGGTITLQTDTDDDMRTYFEYARGAGMPLMVIAPTAQTMPRIERFVREYDIKVAVHVHGPTDQHFPGPQDVLPVIEDMDPRVGICVDLGHTARTGIDLIEVLDMCGPRALDIHIKDLRDLSSAASQCVVGQGNMPIPAIFRQLEKMHYAGYVNLEYEIDADDPLPGMKQSFAYMRGVLAGMESG